MVGFTRSASIYNINTFTHGRFHQVNINLQHQYSYIWSSSPSHHESTTSIQSFMVSLIRSASIYNINTVTHGRFYQVNMNLQHQYSHIWSSSPSQHQSTTSIQSCMVSFTKLTSIQTQMVGFTKSTSIYINIVMHGRLHQVNINLHQHRYACSTSLSQHQYSHA